MFRIGQKVTPIDVADQGDLSAAMIALDEIYTVTGHGTLGDGGCSIYLAEIRRGHPYWGNGWNVSRFRPIVERKPDISIFTEMLNPSKVDA